MWKYVKYYLKTENCCLKICTKHSLIYPQFKNKNKNKNKKISPHQEAHEKSEIGLRMAQTHSRE